jgi:small subunit ribosomal protein S14
MAKRSKIVARPATPDAQRAAARAELRRLTLDDASPGRLRNRDAVDGRRRVRQLRGGRAVGVGVSAG